LLLEVLSHLRLHQYERSISKQFKSEPLRENASNTFLGGFLGLGGGFFLIVGFLSFGFLGSGFLGGGFGGFGLGIGLGFTREVLPLLITVVVLGSTVDAFGEVEVMVVNFEVGFPPMVVNLGVVMVLVFGAFGYTSVTRLVTELTLFPTSVGETTEVTVVTGPPNSLLVND
jgi:hypothetical protein